MRFFSIHPLCINSHRFSGKTFFLCMKKTNKRNIFAKPFFEIASFLGLGASFWAKIYGIGHFDTRRRNVLKIVNYTTIRNYNKLEKPYQLPWIHLDMLAEVLLLFAISLVSFSKFVILISKSPSFSENLLYVLAPTTS